MRLDDELSEARHVALDDPLLCLGFHVLESSHRWTAGRARLPAALLAGLEGTVFLRLDLFSASPARWGAPQAETDAGADAPEVRAA